MNNKLTTVAVDAQGNVINPATLQQVYRGTEPGNLYRAAGKVDNAVVAYRRLDQRLSSEVVDGQEYRVRIIPENREFKSEKLIKLFGFSEKTSPTGSDNLSGRHLSRVTTKAATLVSTILNIPDLCS